MATIKDIDETTKCFKLTREEAVKVISGLVQQLAEVGPQGLPEVSTEFGYRIAFLVGSK